MQPGAFIYPIVHPKHTYSSCVHSKFYQNDKSLINLARSLLTSDGVMLVRHHKVSWNYSYIFRVLRILS